MQLKQTVMPLGVVLLGWVVGTEAVQAQVVATPAGQPGATNTVVTPSGQVLNITGGETSGTNLFHSFSQFGLTQGETANFQTPGGIANVLSRVTGGTASIIDGQIQLSGNASANLYLMNPAGVIFGPNATLNVPASFTATTATAIGFQDNTSTNQAYFNAVGENIYANLTGAPTALLFPPGATGSVVNLGNLSVSAGATNTLALFGNTVLQGADVNAPGANVVAASLPSPRVVRLSQPGNLLSLEFPAGSFAAPNGSGGVGGAFNAFSITSLPALITGSGFNGASNVTVSGGIVTLTGAGGSTTINVGDLGVGNINVTPASGAAAGSSASSVILISSGNLTAGNIANAVASGANIALTGSVANGGTLGGGTVRLASGFFSGQGNANGTLAVGNIANAANIVLESGGGIVGGLLSTRGVTIGRNDAIRLIARNGGIRVINLLANNVNAAGDAGQGSNIVISAPNGTFQAIGLLSSAAIGGGVANGAGTVLSTVGADGAAPAGGAASIAANGTISISQLGGGANTTFLQGANLERDTNGFIIYRLASNQNIRVLINGVNADGSLILLNAVTGQPIAGGGNVVVRRLATANTNFVGGGTDGLILRLVGANSALNGGLGLFTQAPTGSSAVTIASANRLNAGSQQVVVNSGGQNVSAIAAVSGNPAAGQLPTGNPIPVVSDNRPDPDIDNRPDPDIDNPRLDQTTDQARNQIELDNTGDDLSAEAIRTAAIRSTNIIASSEAATTGEEGALTRRVERQVEVPVPVEAPIVVEKEEEEEEVAEAPKPKKIQVLPQLW